MLSAGITYPIALLAGLSSFVSPCILPLVPSYLAFLAGDAKESGVRIRVLRSLVFVAGLGLVFVFLGASFGLFGSVTGPAQAVVGKIAGSIVIVFGLHFMELVRLPFLMREYSIQKRAGGGTMSALRAFLLGAAFALGWTPCVGPILTSILFLSSQAATLLKGMSLLALYSLGLGVPFVIMAFGYERMMSQVSWLKRHMKLISMVSGALLIVIGAFIILGSVQRFTGWILRFGAQLTYLPEMKRFAFDTITSSIILALGAGLVAWRVSLWAKQAKPFPWGGVVMGVLLISAGLIGAFHIVTPSAVLSAWLSFQGL